MHSFDSDNAAYLPETQIIQLSEPSNENLPALQGKQSTKPTPPSVCLNFPTGHFLQDNKLIEPTWSLYFPT